MTPETVDGIDGSEAGKQATQIDIGQATCAVLADGSVKCWGFGIPGLMGNGTSTSSLSPVAVTGLTDAVQVSVGNNHACALLATGAVKCWGRDLGRNLGNDSINGGGNAVVQNTPVDATFAGTSNLAVVASGYAATCVLRANDKVFCWGQNSSAYDYELGIGQYPYSSAVPILVGEPSNTDSNYTSTGVLAGGTSVTLSGPFLGGATAVSVGGQNATITGYNAFWNTITFTTPAGPAAGAVDIAVTTPQGVLTLTDGFTYVAALPGITTNGSFRPGTVGTPLLALDITTTGLSEPVTFTISGGSLPAGLTLTPSGTTAQIAGTPTAEESGVCLHITASATEGSARTPSCIIFQVSAASTTSSSTSTSVPSSGGGSSTTVPSSGDSSTSSSSTTTTTVAGGSGVTSQAPSLVTSANQEQVAASAGTAKILINGELVEVELVQAPEALRRTAPGARTFAEVRALQTLAQEMVAAVQKVLGAGGSLPISVSNTSTGATITGLVTDPVTGAPMAVPVEDVLLIVNQSLVLMVGGADGANNPANIAFDGVLEFGEGGYVAVLAYGLTPGAAGEVVVMSTPTLLDTFEVGSDGGVAIQSQIPTNIAPGDHTVVVAVDGQSASLGFRVLSPGVLPSTGDDQTPLPWAVLVLAAGAFAVLTVTRRRTTI